MKVKDGISSRAEGWETSWENTGVIQLEEGGAPISVNLHYKPVNPFIRR